MMVAAGCGSTGSAGPKAAGGSEQAVASGTQAADFSLRDANGSVVNLSDYLGKQVVILDFWATYCIPCGEELQHLQALYQKHKDKGFVVLGIAMDGPESIAQVPTYVNRYGMTFPVLLDEETKAVNLYNPKRTMPLTVEIDRKGVIARVRSGYQPGDEKRLAAEVEALLGQ